MRAFRRPSRPVRPRRPRRARRPVRFVAVAATLAAAAAAAGCASLPDDDTFSVVATTTQLGDFARNLVGDDGVVYQLLQPGTGAHGFDPSASDLVALSRADIVLENGVGLEEWLPDALAASGSQARVVDASAGIALRVGADEHDETAAAPADDEAHAADSPDHGAADPHVWHSVPNAEQMVATIRDALVQANPAATRGYSSRADAYLQRLDALDEWIRTSLAPVPPAQRLLVTNHDSLGYYVDEYDLEFVGAVIPSLDDNAEASAAQIDALVALIRETGAPAVFAESSIAPAAAQTIADEAGVPVYDGERALYGDALGVEGSAGATYIGALVHNTSLIVRSWGVEPAALPPSFG